MGVAGTDPAGDAIEAMAIFGRVLEQVTDEHLELSTPCTEWNVEALISHVVLGDASIPLLFDGKPLDVTVAINPSILGRNPMATWRGTALAAIEAFRRPGAMDQVVAHPVGNRPGSVVARFRLVDLLGHSWDLATAIGVDVELPDDLAETALDFLFPMVDPLKKSEFFDHGLQIEPAPDASPAVRFLALIGRDATQN